MVKFANQAGPHLRGKNSTFKMMMEFFGCVVALWVAAIIFYSVSDTFLSSEELIARNYYGWYYGLKVIGMGVCAMLFSVLADAIFYLPIFWKDEKRLNLPKGETRVKAYFKKFIFNYSYVSGLLVALLLPVGTPMWVVMITSFGATFVFKNVFGGFGGNIFNPAIIGRIFAQLCFSAELKTFLGEKPLDFTINTGASITSTLFSGTDVFNINNSITQISTLDMFLGKYFGTLGETFAFLLIIIGIYLIVRRIIDWRVPTFFIGTIFVTYLLMAACQGMGVDSFEFAFRAIMAGGVLFGGVLCLTDPVTSPVNRTGKIIFATGAAFITMMIRFFAAAPEGVAYSILIMNMVTPLIDRLVYARTNQHMWTKYTAISVLPAASLLFGVSFGAMNQPTYSPNKYYGFNEMTANQYYDPDSFRNISVDRADRDQVLKLASFTLTDSTVTGTDRATAYYANLMTSGASYGDIMFSAILYKDEQTKDLNLYSMYLIDDSEMNTESNGLYEQVIGSIFYTDASQANYHLSKYDKNTHYVVLGGDPSTIISGATSTDTLPAINNTLVKLASIIDPTNVESKAPGMKAMAGDSFDPESMTAIEFDKNANKNVLELYSFEFTEAPALATSNTAYYARMKTSGSMFGAVEFSAIIIKNGDKLTVHHMYLVDGSEMQNNPNNGLYEHFISLIFDLSTKLEINSINHEFDLGSSTDMKDFYVTTAPSSAETVPDVMSALAQAASIIRG